MNLIAQALIEGGTGKIECPVLAAIARRAECSAGTLYMIARGHKTASAKLSLRIEQATGGKVTRHDLRPDVFGPAEEASKGTATEQPSARAVVDQQRSGLAPTPVASSGVSKRALRQRLGFAADAPLAKLLRLPLEQVASWPDDQPMPALPQVLQLLGRGDEPGAPSARADQDPDAGRIVAVEGA